VNHEELESLAPAYALGALDGEDLVQFRNHLQTCESCRKLVSEHEETSLGLAFSLRPERPSDGLRARVLSEVRQSRRRRASFSRARVFLAAAVLVIAVLGMLFLRSRGDVGTLERAIAGLYREADYLRTENQRTTGELSARRTELEGERKKLSDALETIKARDQGLHERKERIVALERQLEGNRADLARLEKMDVLIRDIKTQIFALTGGDPAKAARARVFWKGTEILFRPSDLPALPAAKLYELWMLVPDKDPIPANLYDGSGNVVKEYNKIPSGVEKVLGFALTLEDQGGADKPTSALYLVPQKD
jgi:anti-sigma-K factor RskA